MAKVIVNGPTLVANVFGMPPKSDTGQGRSERKTALLAHARVADLLGEREHRTVSQNARRDGPLRLSPNA